MPSRKLTFHNSNGTPLSARLDVPVDDTPHAYALFAHCFTCNKNLRAVSNISRALTEQGIGVLRFDFTGLGESEGAFEETTFSSNIEDLEAAAAYLAQHFEAPRILIGHSLGGAAVLQAASRMPSIRAVATIGAPYDPQHVSHLFDHALDEIARRGKARVTLAGRPFTISSAFVEDLSTHHVERTLAGLKAALLVFHSPIDQTVGIENAALIYKAAKHPKSFISLDTADHLLSDPTDSTYVGAVLGAWSKKYLGTGAEQPQHQDPDTNQVIAHTGSQGYHTEILANGHPLVADEPLAVGGTNTGPSPYDLLAAALGACTGMTLRMYADRKQWPLDAITIQLRHQKVHATDCDCETEQMGMIDVIERDLILEGALDDAQRARLLDIANRCPVHRSLERHVVVKSKLRP